RPIAELVEADVALRGRRADADRRAEAPAVDLARPCEEMVERRIERVDARRRLRGARQQQERSWRIAREKVLGRELLAPHRRHSTQETAAERVAEAADHVIVLV